VWFAAIATGARHNATPAVLVLFVALAAVVVPKRTHFRKLALCGVALVGTASLFFVEAGVQSAIGTQSLNPVQSTYIYDLAWLSKQEHKVLLPPEVDPGQSLTTIDRSIDVYGSYNLLFPTFWYPHPPVRFPVEGQAFSALQKAWEHAVLHDPGGYLRERARVATWMLAIGHPSFTLYSPPAAGYPAGFPSLYRAGFDYLGVTAGGPSFPLGPHQYGDFLYDGWIYALILLAGIVVLWRRGKAERIISGLAIGMLVYTVVLAFAGPGELYRYAYPLVATGTVVLVLLLAPVASRLWAAATRGSRSTRLG